MKIETSLRTKLQEKFAPIYLEIENESHRHHRPPGSETHFRIVVAAEAFAGLERVERQRTVMALFDEERAQGLHALSLRVFSPSEWSAQKDKFTMKSPACLDGWNWDPTKKSK